jgi:uncharacterized protein DUF1844
LLRFFNDVAPAAGKERGSEVSNEKEIKVTDKRMFTPEGELREEYRFLSEKSTAAAAAEPAADPVPPPERRPEPPPQAPRRSEPEPASRVDLSTTPPELGGPSFFDLVAILAEPIPIYLGDAPLPDGGDATNLEMARLHIDLLAILRQKTAGNLSAQEAAFLEDLLYRLRVRYVQKRG